MNEIFEELSNLKEKTITQLKISPDPIDSAIVAKKVNYDRAIAWLKKIDELQLTLPKDYIFKQLPETKMAFSEYKVVDTLESDDPNHWNVLQSEEASDFGLYTDDWMLKKKHK